MSWKTGNGQTWVVTPSVLLTTCQPPANHLSTACRTSTGSTPWSSSPLSTSPLPRACASTAAQAAPTCAMHRAACRAHRTHNSCEWHAQGCMSTGSIGLHMGAARAPKTRMQRVACRGQGLHDPARFECSGCMEVSAHSQSRLCVFHPGLTPAHGIKA